MLWFVEHIEATIAIVTALATFGGWNLSQGIRLKSAEAEIVDLKNSVKNLRDQQDKVVKPLYEELRRIGEKLAHIEGFLTAKEQAPRK